MNSQRAVTCYLLHGKVLWPSLIQE